MYEVWCAGCQGPHDPQKHNKLSKKKTAKTPVENVEPQSRLNEEYNLIPGKVVWVESKQNDADALTITGGGLLTNWKRAVISSRYGDSLTLIPDIDNKKLQQSFIPLSSYQVTNADNVFPANDSIVPDLTQLRFIHEPAILWNIKRRSEWRLPYTFIGEVLISVNPLQDVDALANAANMQPNYLFDPHPRTVAERALRKMRFGIKELNRRQALATKQNFAAGSFSSLADQDDTEPVRINQAVIISGESGSGKTENARRVLAQLVEGFEEEENSETGSVTVGVQERILGTEPILEAFGNASTERNSNSSRFGKFLKLYYTIDEEDFVELRGASIETYLLEQARVTALIHKKNSASNDIKMRVSVGRKSRARKPMPGLSPVGSEMTERNYRVFYNVLSAAQTDEVMSERLGFDEADFSFCLTGGRYQFLAKDKSQFSELNAALEQANLAAPVGVLYQLIGGILHLGNALYQLESFNTSQGDAARISAKTALSDSNSYDAYKWAVDLLGLDQELFERLFLQSVVKVGREEMVKKRSVDEAKNILESVARKIFSLTFDWLVLQLNGNLWDNNQEVAVTVSECNFVGIVDVFGFESFENNGLEQLLINYANEVLQNIFTQQVIIAEAELCKREGISLDSAEQDGKTSTKNLLVEKDARNRFAFFNTLFKILDSSMRVPSPSDSKFLKEIQKKLRKNDLFQLPHRKDLNHKFLIRHFAATTTYTVGEFQAKNQDQLGSTTSAIGALFVELLEKSTNPILKHLPLVLRAEEEQNVPSKRFAPTSMTNPVRSKTDVKSGTRKSLYKSMQNLGRSKSFKNLKSMSSSLNVKGLSMAGRKKKPKQVSISLTFKTQVAGLQKTLSACGCSYIRCIKPNPKNQPPDTGRLKNPFNRRSATRENVSELYNFYGYKKAESVLKSRRYNRNKNLINRPDVSNHYRLMNLMGAGQNQSEYFNSEYVTKQLHCLGIFDAVQVLKSGLPTRISFSTFMDTFSAAIPKESSVLAAASLKQAGNERPYIAALLWAFKVPPECFRLGTTMVFFRFGQLDFVSSILNSANTWKENGSDASRARLNNLLDQAEDDQTESNFHSKEEVVHRFKKYFVRMYWRKTIVKIVATNHFTELGRRARAARVIQRFFRKALDQAEFALKQRLDMRATELQRIWRGYKGRQVAVEMRAERAQREKLLKRSREIAKKKKSRINDFEAHQTMQRKKLEQERKKEIEKSLRVEKKLQKWQEAREREKKLEVERQEAEAKKADALRQLLEEEENIRKKKEHLKEKRKQEMKKFHDELGNSADSDEQSDDSDGSIEKISSLAQSNIRSESRVSMASTRSKTDSRLKRKTRGTQKGKKYRSWRKTTRKSVVKERLEAAQNLIEEAKHKKSLNSLNGSDDPLKLDMLNSSRTSLYSEKSTSNITRKSKLKRKTKPKGTKSRYAEEVKKQLMKPRTSMDKRNSENNGDQENSTSTDDSQLSRSNEPPVPSKESKPRQGNYESSSEIEDNGSQETPLFDDDPRVPSLDRAFSLTSADQLDLYTQEVKPRLGTEDSYRISLKKARYAERPTLARMVFDDRLEKLQTIVNKVNAARAAQKAADESAFNKVSYLSLRRRQREELIGAVDVEQLGESGGVQQIATSASNLSARSVESAGSGKRQWVNGAKKNNRARYRNIQKTLKFPGDKLSKKIKFTDPTLVPKLAKFTLPQTFKFRVLAFYVLKTPNSLMQTGRSSRRSINRRTFSFSSATGSSVSFVGGNKESLAGFLSMEVKRNENWKFFTERKLTLQKLVLGSGSLRLEKVKTKIKNKDKNHKCVALLKNELSITLDHKTKIHIKQLNEEEESGLAGTPYEVFVQHVPDGKTLCFQFDNQKARDEWFYELRKAQIGFFGNDILHMAHRRQLQKLDKSARLIASSNLRPKNMEKQILAAFSVLKSKTEGDSRYTNGKVLNPKFNSSKPGRRTRLKGKKKPGILQLWTKGFFQLGVSERPAKRQRAKESSSSGNLMVRSPRQGRSPRLQRKMASGF
eukprot:maker-scaffold_5-snap-gene-16.1-mRNA-1 protein AED:0.48 eAED:0.51 QI:0/0.33/0/1/1/1/4/0/2004